MGAVIRGSAKSSSKLIAVQRGSFQREEISGVRTSFRKYSYRLPMEGFCPRFRDYVPLSIRHRAEFSTI